MSNQDIYDFLEAEGLPIKSNNTIMLILHSLNIQEFQPNDFFQNEYPPFEIPKDPSTYYNPQINTENIQIFLKNDTYNTDNLLPDVDLQLIIPQAPTINRGTPDAEEQTQTINDGPIGTSEQKKEKIPFKNDYKKNIIGYEAKKAITLMLQHHKNYIFKKCSAEGIHYEQFKKYYKAAEKTIYGPISLQKIFKVNPKKENETKMKRIFQKIFNKILRKIYLVHSLKHGKMQKIESYIRKKNTQLLYFSCNLQMLQNQGI